MNDEILIEGLDLPVRLGVPDEERAAWQSLKADLRLGIQVPFHQMQDDLTETVDYASLAQDIRSLAADKPRKLLETLASEITAFCLQRKNVSSVEVILRKRVLPGTDAVAVRMARSVSG